MVILSSEAGWEGGDSSGQDSSSSPVMIQIVAEDSRELYEDISY